MGELVRQRGQAPKPPPGLPSIRSVLLFSPLFFSIPLLFIVPRAQRPQARPAYLDLLALVFPFLSP
jgi:hypothetical protein